MTKDENPKNESIQERHDRLLVREQKLEIQRKVYWEVIESILAYTEEKSKSDSVTMAISEILFNLFETYYSVCKEIIVLKVSKARMNSKYSNTVKANPD